MSAGDVAAELERMQEELNEVEQAARETANAADDLSIEVDDIRMHLEDADDMDAAYRVLREYAGRVEQLGARIMGYEATEKFERLVNALNEQRGR